MAASDRAANHEADIVTEVARRHGLSESAAGALWEALVAGRGTQAQFSHPDLGGMGQWSGGMAQIGDMFNADLKAKVVAACRDLAEYAARLPADRQASGTHQSQRQGDAPSQENAPREAPNRDWWPEGLGQPSSTGAQNDARYAMFPDRRRLAVWHDGAVMVYDTGDHRISGFSQQQGGSSSMTFTSNEGPIALGSLRRVDEGNPDHVRALVGGCFCGQVRYEARGTPFHETLCHCVDCRRAAGAPAVAWFTVLRSEFRVTTGEPAVFRSSARAVRRFCPNCGTQLTFEADAHPEEVDVTTASLDDPDAVPPRDHSYATSRVSWDHIDANLPVRQA